MRKGVRVLVNIDVARRDLSRYVMTCRVFVVAYLHIGQVLTCRVMSGRVRIGLLGDCGRVIARHVLA
jgi:hypothetical protein